MNELLEKVDIIKVVSKYVSLKRVGSQYAGLCPFHKEKTPSFYVDPDKGIYHCFGCGASGNAITFLSEIEGITRREALSILAEEFGLDIGDYGNDKRPVIYEVLRESVKFYKSQLMKHTLVMDYLKNRGLSSGSLAEWEIGFSPDKYGLIKHLIKKGFSSEDILSSGVAISNGKEIFDRFHSRIIFPIKDITGNVVSFAGRVVEGWEPKYLNGPDTKIFKKSEILFGLDKAKSFARKEGFLYLVEGYIDVILMHQEGYKNTVGIMGTHLSEEHAKRIYRFVKKVIIIPDSDEAGIKSAEKSIFVLAKSGIDTYVILLEDGLDPADYLRQSRILPEPITAFSFILGEKPKDPVKFSERLNKAKNFISLLKSSDENLATFYISELEKWAGTKVNVGELSVREVIKRSVSSLANLDKILILGYAYGFKGEVMDILNRLTAKTSLQHKLETYITAGKDFAEFFETLKSEEASSIYSSNMGKEEVFKVLRRILKQMEVEDKVKRARGDIKALLEVYNIKKEVGV